ncbi:Cof-like hydrolase [Acidipropionibacterium acidipropionici ATCC 4875]|jgi:HAD superfamily hydrolase (TIGR01484 family)|uniref:Cof-like hydrolase n=1 Tax=Acidipropionibacterium acidipropionici (strain ATCC 4875 / DSM 20272 / JCM 6432 / NBRC 12425 / NCIMB 8070 / 4) TaxID=1171373 RepID=K7SJ58_ACIA4|nr:HAD-IIB family hydrolase [Acidipropionibacterium acidipropionici]AFV89300.1 Cof-like hydrolase [Acidipropionibacterium acidipropionici ATCC 4875]ALN16151.1 hydrolase [Acidipropionibacterium acidipropionici]APZ08098.1 hydrolase [Acidipropionibacterium acidipropionici]QCV95182.1 HAD-IIB family hydrolase [Acidipropionibacterium acidipropionici]
MPAVDLIASDLDRTFLGADKLPSAENLRAVLDATEAGVKVVFATGRPYRWLDVLGILAPVHPTVISANGAVSVDVATGEVLHQSGFDLEVLSSIVADVRAVVPGALFCTEEARTWGVEPGFDRSFEKGVPDVEAPIEELLARRPKVVKFLVKAYGVPSDELYRTVSEVIGDRAVTTYSFQGPDGILEISAPGVTKGAALAQVCADLGVDPARAAAFGDMPNDMSMLDLVGHPFVVSNAHPDLLARGYTVVGHHDDSAVGRTIQTLLAADGRPRPQDPSLSGAH